MCNTSIMPSVINSKQLNSDMMRLTRIFNRWLKMLTSYGKLDQATLDKDLNVMAAVISTPQVNNKIKQAVGRCRDYALLQHASQTDLIGALKKALHLMCGALEGKDIYKVKKAYKDQGMTERYRPLKKRLAREKIRKIGREVIYTDQHTDSIHTTRLVRRIVEKRAAQMAHKCYTRPNRDTKLYRHLIDRAVSFNLASKKIVEYDNELRMSGTHWKVVRHKSKRKKALLAKYSYNSYEEAVAACNRYKTMHPGDLRPLSAYKCNNCGKWHIGHGSYAPPLTHSAEEPMQENDEKITA